MKKLILPALTLSLLLNCPPAHASSTYHFDQNLRPSVAADPIAGLKGVTFVPTARHAGYYVVSPGSNAFAALGLQHAPYIDSDNTSRSGVGLDAIVFRFGADGKLEGFPVYISQLATDSFYTKRLQGLSPEHSTFALVRELFDGQTIRLEKQGSRTVAYLEVPVYNPLTSGS